jgi:transglutaminase-like putative cysteine protease
MLLSIRHETIYLYTAHPSYTIQQLRLSPRQEPHQRVLAWNISTPGRRSQFIDAYGNLSHILTITGAHNEVRIVASGKVDVVRLDRGRLAERGELSPLVFTVPTRLTETTETVHEFALQNLPETARSNDLLALAEAIRGTVAYRSGATAVTTTATDALRLREGVCQDHAHLFLACCHVRNIPVRYVSGYIDPGTTSHGETHAWIDAWIEEAGFSGWVSIDVTHGRFADDAHCRLAVGRDYESAAPVRGVRSGGGTESLSVKVEVTSVSLE